MKSLFETLMEEVQTTDLNTLLSVERISLRDLAHFLYKEGFKNESRFSNDDCRIYLSEDSRYMIVISGRLGKLYSTKNQKTPLHVFAIVKSQDTQ